MEHLVVLGDQLVVILINMKLSADTSFGNSTILYIQVKVSVTKGCI